MEVLLLASFIAAFLAGFAALFAPCCITVLLPSYLASVFHEKKAVLAMTGVFSLGVLLVFLPLGLGIAAFGVLLQKFHTPLYIAGGTFLILLGVFILLGKRFSISLPYFHKQSAREAKGAGAVFLIGVFSGIATLCCAPVLAGVLALSLLPGSVLWGLLYAVAYVAGMTIPLFLLAFLLDRTKWQQRISFLQHKIRYSLFGEEREIAAADLLSGFIFLFMGFVILFLAKQGGLAMGGGEYAVSVNIFISKLTEFLTDIFKNQ